MFFFYSKDIVSLKRLISIYVNDIQCIYYLNYFGNSVQPKI